MQHCFFILFGFLLYQGCTVDSTSADVVETLPMAEQRKPENALYGLTADEDLSVQLFASEPMVRNPSNIDVDHRGRVWVVENVNYRPENNPDNAYQEGGDMIVILEDLDGDGKADDRKVFYQDTLVDGAMGIAVLDHTVYLSSSPHILVLTDIDRDDQADLVDTLFTGMGRKQGDHTVHAVSFGPDGRLYFNFGNAGHQMLHKDGSPVIDKMGQSINDSGDPYRQGMVFRCEMDGTNVETLGHNFRNNYEVCVDSYGRMWQSDNDDDGNKSVRINYVMEFGNYGYRDEMTGAPWQTFRTGWNEEIPKRHWHQNDPGVIPTLYITGSGSPCGIAIYEGDLLPKKFHGQIIHSDAGPGSVHAFILEPSGAGFNALRSPILQRKSDNWYRPTDVSVAPDGSIFVSDWYDPGVGGHWAGDAEQGRIFRITTPLNESYPTGELALDLPEKAVQALESPNLATRYLAWQAIADFDQEAEGALVSLWNKSKSLVRARALWLLARLKVKYVVDALGDPDASIRATAIRACRRWHPQRLHVIIPAVLTDPAAQVRREAAIALREMQDPQHATYWAQLAAQHDGKDRWYLEALGIAAHANWDDCLQAYFDLVPEWNTSAGHDIIWRSRAQSTFQHLITLLQNPSISLQDQARFLRATDFQEYADKDRKFESLLLINRPESLAFRQMVFGHISADFAKRSTAVKKSMSTILPKIRGSKSYLNIVEKLQLVEEADHLFDIVLDQPSHELGYRAALLLLQFEGWEKMQLRLHDADVETAIALLGNINQTESKNLLKQIVLDSTKESEQRKLAVEALGRDWGWEQRMTTLIESPDLEEDLKSVAATKLLHAARAVDRERGINFLEEISSEPIEGLESLPSIKELMTRSGNVAHGAQIFQKHCINCHRVAGQGIDFGPDLSEIGNKLGKDGLYSAIIYPSAAISHGFEGIHIEMQNGDGHTGYVLEEGEETLHIQMANGASVQLSLSEVSKMETLDQSLMTPGLGHVIGADHLVDLVAYLVNLVNHETITENPFQGKVWYERGDQ